MESTTALQPTSSFYDEEDPDADIPGDHSWHYRYNRRVSCFSHSVASLTFSQDGQWLVSATKSGTVKIFDTEYWAERAKLQGCRNEEPRVIAISPGQRWLVCMFPSVMHIFHCHPPWRLEQRVPAPVDQVTKVSSEWRCVAFSPMSEVDHPGGHAGQDNHLAAFASKTLCVLDYSGGWEDTPKRTASILADLRPTSIAYTSCGFWLVCGYESGGVQIWNHFSLTLDRTLLGHNGSVSCITSSPRCAQYDSRFVSCGMDQTLRVWHSNGWLLEQICPDTRADKKGVRSCMFSSTGDWVVSLAVDICVWRVCISRKGQLDLRLHQRLAAVCGAEDLCTAAICCKHDAIAVGSWDGVLGLWTKLPGWPVEHALKNDTHIVHQRKKERGGVTPFHVSPGGMKLAKPMMHVSPEGVVRSGSSKELAGIGRRSLGPGSQWFVGTDLRSLSDVVSPAARNWLPPAGGRRGPNSCAANGEWAPKSSTVKPSPMDSLTAMRMSTTVRTKLPEAIVQKVSAFGAVPESDCALGNRSSSMPELTRWKSASFECQDVLGALCSSPQVQVNATVRRPMESPQVRRRKLAPLFDSPGTKHSISPSVPVTGCDRELPPLVRDAQSPVRAAILHASKGLVQRISLEPHQIC